MIHQQVLQCAQRCSNVANTLRSTANQAPDQRAREMLTAAAVHLEMCVHGCNDAIQQAQIQQAPVTAGQYQYQPGY